MSNSFFIAPQTNTAGNKQSFPCWFFDFNNDGNLDIFAGGYSTRFNNTLPFHYLKELVGQEIEADVPDLFVNKGNSTFENIAKKAGLNKACFVMGAGYGDMNNDGYLDLYLGTGEPDLKAILPNRAFLNAGGTGFKEITAQARLGHLQKGHGISFADLDFDGDQDIYAVFGGAYEGDNFFNALFENHNNENNWLKLKLEGVQSNRAAIGARIQLIVENSTNERSIYRHISNGSSFGENPFTVEIGILKNERIKKLIIDWPSGQTDEYENINPNSYYLVKEGSQNPQLFNYKPISFQKNKEMDHSHHHH